MVLRYHRAAAALRCWKLAFNLFHRGYDRGDDYNLRGGRAIHAGIAFGRTSHNWFYAIEYAANHLVEHTPVPENEWQAEELATHVCIVRRCVEVYAETHGNEDEVRMIAPEMEFEVPLPGSEHHCVMKHWHNRSTGVAQYLPPSDYSILHGNVMEHRCPECWEPHYLAGRSDAVVEVLDSSGWQQATGNSQQNGSIWIDEYKTTSIWDDRFWSDFLLDQQITVYMYGMWKTLGVMPKGVRVHGFYRPSAKQVEGWNSKRRGGPDKNIEDYIKYDRQLFTREPEDLLRLEADMIELGNEWEWRVKHAKFPMSNVKGICTHYNKLCEFHFACLSHDRQGFDALTRQSDPERLRLYHISAAAQKEVTT